MDAIFRQPQRSVVSNGAEAGFRGLQQQMSGERLKLANYLGLRVFFPTLAAKCRKLVSRYVRPMGILSAFSLFRAADAVVIGIHASAMTSSSILYALRH